MPAGNDFCNNPILNSLFHPVNADVDRGVPEVGKIVTRLDVTPPLLEMCTDTDPDPTFDGGGTWAALLTGLTTFQSFTPSLTANGSNPSIDPTIATKAGYVTIGPICVAWWYIQFGASMSPGSGVWHLDKPIPAVSGASGNWCVGSGLIVDNSTGASEFVILENRAAGDMYITYAGNTVANNLPWTWAPSDEIRVFAIYPIA